MKTLVIGYGNTLRGDDGVGYRVAERLQTEAGDRLDSRPVHQLTPELALDIAQVDRVWFVDAWIAGTIPTMQPLTLTPVAPVMDHRWQPTSLLHLAKTLYEAEPVAYQLLIPAADFDYGEHLSSGAQAGMEWAVQTIQASVNPAVVDPKGGLLCMKSG